MTIQQLLDAEMLKEQEKRANRQGSGLISPSSFGRCLRFQYWRRSGEKETNPVDLLTMRRFKCGDLFHDFVQQYLPSHQVEVECLKDDIKGFADIVTDDCVYDIKSQHSKSFWYASKEGYDIKKERFSNWLQVATYAWILGKPRISLVLISKDDLCISEFADFTDKWVEHIEYELLQLRKFWGIKKLPAAHPRAYGTDKKGNSTECRYCPYQIKCKEVESGESKDS